MKEEEGRESIMSLFWWCEITTQAYETTMMEWLAYTANTVLPFIS